MGYSQSWLAVKGKTRAEVLDALELRETGTREEIASSPIVGAELSAGWYLVVANRSEHRLTRDGVLQRLSVGCEVITGDVEEHVMVSAAGGWNNGHRVWSVMHDGQRSVKHLETKGDLPAAFAGIRDKLLAQQQAEVEGENAVDHMFDVPVELAKTLTGYRHDAQAPTVHDTPFEVLAGDPPSLFKKLFGGRRLNSFYPS